jgi:hypothetical protein
MTATPNLATMPTKVDKNFFCQRSYGIFVQMTKNRSVMVKNLEP